MLTLKLTLNNGQVAIHANDVQSHSFSLHDLRLNDVELKAFVQNPRPYGARLFQALFKDGSAAKTAFDELSKHTARTIVLVLKSSELDGVAWEYAYNQIKQEYAVEDCAFMRALPEGERPANGRLKESVERVSLLFIPANPLVDLNAEPMRALDVDGEWREMTRHIMASHAPFDLLQLRPATPEQLQTSMARFRDGLAVHFSGHGAAMKDGTILLFERENGASNPLGAREFIRAVKDKAGIVFLSACQSAAAEKTEFGNLARGLVKSGVPFALGMQFNLPDPFAPVISGQFYNWLAQGHAIPEATMQARRAIKREHEFFVGMIALYAAHPDETGEMNWRGSGASLVQTVRPADVSDLPSPASGLIGRQRELMRIGTQLIETKKPLTVTLHGAGGIGKTALLWQSLLRFAPSFDLTLALALDPLPSLESILGRIERFLGLPSPCANDTKERETLVRERLTCQRTLLGLDNFETLNYALNEKDSNEEKTAKSLNTFFKSLAANGVNLCITSREVTNLPGETIEDIQGLTNENGGRLFQENVVRQKDEIYIEKTQQVSEMVGGHPLALRLLASAFDDQVGMSLDQYIEDLQSHLPKARDKWTEEDRHESLRASFDFTMHALQKTENGVNLQGVLSRVSLFKSFFSPIFVAPVIVNKWFSTDDEMKAQFENAEMISQTLWERGLLERITIPSQDGEDHLYHLHPALAIFARNLLTDHTNIKEIYWNVMARIAGIAEDEVSKSVLMARTALFAMPDLMSVANTTNSEDVALMKFRVGKILRKFGHYYGALNFLIGAHNIYKSLNLQRDKAVMIGEMGSIYTLLGNLDKGLELQNEKIAIVKEIGDLHETAITLGEIGEIEAIRGNLDEATKKQEEKLSIVNILGDRYEISVAQIELARIFVKRNNLDAALNFYQKSLDVMEEQSELGIKSIVLHDMAEIYVRRGDFDKAKKLYYQSLKICEDLGDLAGKAVALSGIAYLYRKNEKFDLSEKYYSESIDIMDRHGAIRNWAITVGMLGELYWEQRKYNEAVHALLSGLIVLLERKIEPQTQDAMISNLIEWRRDVGAEKFEALWQQEMEIPVPKWLTQNSE